jgi:hypothetical protein
LTACSAHEETDREANDSREGDDSTNAVAVAHSDDHYDPDYEQGSPSEEPKGDEDLPATGVHTFARDHGTASLHCADEWTPIALAARSPRGGDPFRPRSIRVWGLLAD